MKKKISLSKITSFAFLLTMIVMVLVAGTYAKYTSTASGTDAKVVANWSFKVNGEEIAVDGDPKTVDFGLFTTILDSNGDEETDVQEGLIAPGTSGSFEFNLENTSDVTAQYSIDFDVTNEKNIPIEFSLDGITWNKQLNNITASTDTIMAINGTKAVTIKWRWAFDGDSAIDTNLGTEETAPTITVKATINATQVDTGLKVSILGDSISTLKGYIPSGNRTRYVQQSSEATGGLIQMSYADTWWGSIINELDMNLGINESWAGSTVFNNLSTDNEDLGPNRAMSSMTRLEKLDDNGTPDLIFFFGGTNDIGRKITLGTFNSKLNLDRTTTVFNNFADAYTMTILRLKSLYPNAKIISILPTYTTSYYTNEELIKYNNVIKEICNYYNIKYIDINNSGISTADLEDGIHPNVLGMSKIKNYIVSDLKNNVSKPVQPVNYYKSSELKLGYYNESGTWDQSSNVQIYSVTIPVNEGDKLDANSFKKAGDNGSVYDRNAIRITFLLNDDIVKSLSPTEVYEEYSTKGYVTVPAGVNKVNVPWWTKSDSNYLYVNN